MATTSRGGFARAGSYWQVSRAPRYSLLFALPLLVLYQILATLEPVGRQGSLRNGADVILEGLFIALAGRWGPLVFMVCLIAGGLWLVTRDMRRHGGPLRTGVFGRMLAESILLALVFGFAVAALTSQFVRPPAMIGPAQVQALDWWTRLMLSVGAGIYEELLFRVVLVTALAWLGESVLGWRPTIAGVWATLLGAILFSTAHYIGPYGDRLTLYSFVFRMIAGVYFSGLYLLRGFGITAWTHALYDLILLVAPH
jgi:Type II CAAX prenyl endopeptidase Rce1-like